MQQLSTDCRQRNEKSKPRRDKDQTSLEDLSRDETIVITKPDKGRGIVLLNRNDYNTKIQQILSDSETFESIHQA